MMPAVDRIESELPAFLTPADVADLLQVHERTILRWAQQDASMPVTRLGRIIRFEKAPLMRWLARKRPWRTARRKATSPPRNCSPDQQRASDGRSGVPPDRWGIGQLPVIP